MKHLKKFTAAVLAAMALTALFGAGSVSATTLEIGGVTQNGSISITASLKAGTSMNLKDTFGLSLNTCTGSETKGNTNSPFSGTTVTATVELSFSSCSRATLVHKGGTLHVSEIAGTTHGTLSSSGSEWTTGSPFGGLNCKTGTGTHIGNLEGTKSGHALMVIHAHINCSGISSIWDAEYTVTSPTGLGVSK